MAFEYSWTCSAGFSVSKLWNISRKAAISASLARVVARTPLGRDTTTAEVAEWVAALGSGIADAVSGASIEIDGGSGLVAAAALEE